MILSLSSCSKDFKSPNDTRCDELPIFNKKDFRWVRKNPPLVNKFIQINAIKNCSCLEPSEQEICYQKYTSEKIIK